MSEPALADEARPAPRLIERLRALFGLGAVSIRDDIQDALEDTSAGPTSPPRSGP